jgi:hypothetical protein
MLSYILMQDMSLATVFVGNFSKSAKIIIERIKKTVCFLIENATTLTIRTTYDVIKIARLESADRESDRW